MTDQRAQSSRLWAILSVVLAALLLLSACADVVTEDDGTVVEGGDGVDPADVDCSIEALEAVQPASMIGFVGDATVTSECGTDIDSQTLTVCIQTAPGGEPGSFPPSAAVSSDFAEIGCVEAIGTGFASATPTFPGIAGNNWYRLSSQLVAEDTAFDQPVIGSVTNITTFDPVVNVWVPIHCFVAVDGCAEGFAEEPVIEEPTPVPTATPVAPTPTPVIEDPVIDDPSCDDLLIEPGALIDDGPCIIDDDPDHPPII